MPEDGRNPSWAYDARGGQRYEGPSLFADSYALRKLPILGSVTQGVRGRMRNMHGRYLSGLGGEQPDGRQGYDPQYQDESTYDLEAQDDVFGSGIFDPGSRGGTANANMGVFASHYSLPGYIARNIPFTVSRDVSDVTDGAEVVTVPAGGMTFVEQAGRLTRPAVTGPTWRPKALTPAGVTDRDQPYAFLNRPGQPYQTALNPDAPVTGAPTYGRPARDSKFYADPVAINRPEAPLPLSPRQGTLQRQMVVSPQNPAVAIPNVRSTGVSGLGAADKAPASLGQLFAAGTVAGVAVGLMAMAMKKP